MKKILAFICVLSVILTCCFSLSSVSFAVENSDTVFDWFSNAANYSGHHYGSFGGVSKLNIKRPDKTFVGALYCCLCYSSKES